jgi:nitroimidazol reductase NimA-like FMN-containing flavoprotein (pyridoxamine 5'-phosphate oxidase superfamily)
VGLADTDGTPYVLPMNFGYRDGVIYLHSAQEGRSISILERNPRVCITFSTDHDLVFQHPEVACSYRMRSKSVICWGEVHFEEDFDKKTEALDIIMKQYSDKEFRYSDPAVKNVKIWIVEMDEVTCKEFGVPHNKLKIGS